MWDYSSSRRTGRLGGSGSNASACVTYVFRPRGKGVGAQHDPVEALADVIVPVRDRTAAVLESSVGIFVLAAGRLHDAVERDELGNDQLSHRASRLEVSAAACLRAPSS